MHSPRSSSELGSAPIFAALALAATGLVLSMQSHRGIENRSRTLLAGQKSYAINQTNINALALTTGLLQPKDKFPMPGTPNYYVEANKVLPPIFPDPYFPMSKTAAQYFSANNSNVPGATDAGTGFQWSHSYDENSGELGVVKITDKSMYAASSKKKKATTQVVFEEFLRDDPSRPLLITKARVTLWSGIGKFSRSDAVEKSALISIPTPPTPTCVMIAVAPLSVRNAQDPLMCGRPDIPGNPDAVPPIPPTPQPPVSCAGNGQNWDIVIDGGDQVNISFTTNGIIKDIGLSGGAASVRNAVKQNLSPATTSNPTTAPFEKASSIGAIGVTLATTTYTPADTDIYSMKVTGVDNTSSTCSLAIHVDNGPAENTAEDSFLGKTPVKISSVETVEISKIKEGDAVWNPILNKSFRVQRLISRKYQGNITTIWYEKKSIQVTEDHPIATKEGFVPARDIELGTLVLLDSQLWSSVSRVQSAPANKHGILVYDLLLDYPSNENPKMNFYSAGSLTVADFDFQRFLVAAGKARNLVPVLAGERGPHANYVSNQ